MGVQSRARWAAALWWVVTLSATGCAAPEPSPASVRAVVLLPSPLPAGSALLDEVLAKRRSRRGFEDRPLTLDETGRLFWSGQGITDAEGHRAAPSAGALFPIELYGVSAAGVVHYVPAGHKLEELDVGDVREELWQASLRQDVVRDAPMVLVVTGVISRTRGKYGDRAERYVALEAGHVAQNVLLQATALELGAVPVGAFEDEAVRSALRLPTGMFPYYLICVGRPAGNGRAGPPAHGAEVVNVLEASAAQE